MDTLNDAFEELTALQSRLEKIKQAGELFGDPSTVPTALKEEQFSVERQIAKLRESLSSTVEDLYANADPANTRKPRAFTIMAFANPYDEYYRDIIKPALLDVGYDCVRSDEIYSPGVFLQTIWQQIVLADVMIAEMTDMNPNVLYELGLAHSISKKVIMITQDIGYIPSDLRHINCILYDTTGVSWADKLRSALQRMVLFQAKDRAEFVVLHPKASVENTMFYEKLSRERDFLQDRTSRLEKQITNYATHVKDLRARIATLTQEQATVFNAVSAAVVAVRVDESGDKVFVQHLPAGKVEIEYVEVERGPFTFGVGASAREIEIDTFYISRFAVTNGQFCEFLNVVGNRTDDGYHWIDIQGRSPVDQCRISRSEGGIYVVEDGYSDHPVTYVNFYGASAFCAWVGGHLPTVEEWEKAVRGTDGRDYPWGNNPPTSALANIGEDGWSRDVKPIEVYRKVEGASPFGVIQGIGNVWHWTSTYYPDRDVQAVRGGSFFDFRLGGRSVYRFLVQPNGPDFSQGFMVAKRFLAGWPTPEDNGEGKIPDSTPPL